MAENLRNLQFYYYIDPQGTKLLMDPDDTTKDIATTYNADSSMDVSALDKAGNPTGALGGDGAWDAAKGEAATHYNNRAARGSISFVRVKLTGLNSSPEPGYTNTTETITTLQNYRQYSLSSLIVPRNLGLTGFREQNYDPPQPPTIKSICIGFCNVPVIYWDPPVGGGPVQKYVLGVDTDPNGAYSTTLPVQDPSQTSVIFKDDGLNPNVKRYYKIWALNENGQSQQPSR